MATVSGIEYLNKSFNPLGLHLDGWSEQVMDSLEDFDQTFEQLHDKYQGSSEVSPEWNLFIMLLGSGFMFHLSNSLFKSVLPNVNDVAKNNPDLMSQIASAMGNAMGNSNGQQTAPSAMAGQNSSELGASLAMRAMQQKLRPQEVDSVIEEDEYSEMDTEPPPGFEQATALRKPPPPMGRPVPKQSMQTMMDDAQSDDSVSDVSSDLSMSDAGGEVKHITPDISNKRATTARKGGGNKKQKKSVSITL